MIDEKNKKITTKQSNGSFTISSRQELPIIQNDKGLLIDARLLHKKLLVKEKFADWIKRRISEYKFLDGIDYFRNFGSKIKKHGGNNIVEYHFTLDTGKELAMLERNEVGRAIRRYFIQAEKDLRSSRLYAATATITEINKSIKPLLLNGRKLYPFRVVAETLGYSPNISIPKMTQRGWGGLFVKFENKTFCAEEYVKVMMARAKARAITTEAKAALPVLPADFGVMPVNKKGGAYAR